MGFKFSWRYRGTLGILEGPTQPESKWHAYRTTKRVNCENGMESWTLISAEALDPGSNPLLLMEVSPSSQHTKLLGAFLVLSHTGCSSNKVLAA